MPAKRILLFTVLNFVTIFACDNEVYDKKSCGSSMRLFLTSSFSARYMKSENPEDLIGFKTLGVLAIDYHAAKNLIFMTSPKYGFWEGSPKLHSVTWDYKFKCEDEENDEDCTILNDDPWSNNDIYDDLKKRYDASGYKLLRQEAYWYPRSLAVDYVNDKLYYTDLADRSVSILNLDGSNKSVIFEDTHVIPLEVVLDPLEGLMFIYAANTNNGFMQIYRANMDGSDRQLLIDGIAKKPGFYLQDKIGFALDTIKKKMYFSNLNDEAIESANYFGKERMIVVRSKYPVSVSIYRDNLYWMDANVSSRESFLCFNKTCLLQRCKLDADGTCRSKAIENLIKKKDVIGLHNIKLADPSLQIKALNPCDSNEIQCQHHCLLRKNNDSLSFACTCNVGYKLLDDRKSCQREEVTHVYENYLIPDFDSFKEIDSKPNGTSLFPMPMDLFVQLALTDEATVSTGEPFKFVRVVDKGKRLVESVGIPYDKMVVEDKYNDYIKNLSLGRLASYRREIIAKNMIRHYYENQTVATAIAYDWMAKNIYYVKLAENDDEFGELFALRLSYKHDPKNTSVVKNKLKIRISLKVSHKSKNLGKFPVPVSMVAHPHRGYVFASLRNGSIVRFNTDGSDRFLLPNNQNASTLAIDFVDDSLFYVNNKSAVSKVNLDGTGTKRLFKITTDDNPNAMYVHDRFVYLRMANNVTVGRYDKLTGENKGSFNISSNVEKEENDEDEDEDDGYFYGENEPKENKYPLFHKQSVGVKVNVKETKQAGTLKHPCELDNGECEGLCFAVPDKEVTGLKRICACDEDDEKLLIENGCDTTRFDVKRLNEILIKLKTNLG